LKYQDDYHQKITKLRLNLSKLCVEILWLLFSGHGVLAAYRYGEL